MRRALLELLGIWTKKAFFYTFYFLTRWYIIYASKTTCFKTTIRRIFFSQETYKTYLNREKGVSAH